MTVPVVHDSKPERTMQPGPGTPECITLHLCFCQDLCHRVWTIIHTLHAEQLWCIYQKKVKQRQTGVKTRELVQSMLFQWGVKVQNSQKKEHIPVKPR